MTTARKLITADELMMIPDDGKRYKSSFEEYWLKRCVPETRTVLLYCCGQLHPQTDPLYRSGGPGVTRTGSPGYRLERAPIPCAPPTWHNFAQDERTALALRQAQNTRSNTLAKTTAATTTTTASTRPRHGPSTPPPLVKALVITVAAGLPRFSASIPSWRPHAVQDPQSATA